MLELLLELVLELVVEVVFQVFVELAFELGLRAVATPRRHPAHPFLAAFGYAVLGAALGWGSLWLFPDRIVPFGGTTGLSIVVSPLCAGTALHYWGAWQRSRGRRTTSLATFHGGAAFAFGMALVRWLGVAR
jgi:hypothetical protein